MHPVLRLDLFPLGLIPRTMLRCFPLFIATALTMSAQTPTPAPDLQSNASSSPSGPAALNPDLPTIFIAGDSTAARGRPPRQQGWGVPFADYFDLSKVNIVNRAIGGRSSRTFITDGAWDRLLAHVKKGDTVLIQFGHNDGGAINDEPPPPLRARGSLRGLGEETREIDNVLTKQHEIVHTFGWYLRKMIADVKAKEANPIVLSLTLRNIWKDGKIERGSGRYGEWSFDVAKYAAVPFIDLTNRTADAFDQLGAERVKALYPQDHTHFNAEGADLHAAMVVAGLKGLRPSPVAKLLSAKGDAVVAKAKGTTPVLWSLISRKNWKVGKIVRPVDRHADWTRAASADRKVLFLPPASRPARFGGDSHQLISDRRSNFLPATGRPFAELNTI
jgi:lysophospholipase L1-like esterase